MNNPLYPEGYEPTGPDARSRRIRRVMDPTKPKFQTAFNAVFLVFWIVMLPITLLTSLKSSLTFVAAISVWALIAAHFVGWIAARVGAGQQGVQQSLDEHRDHATRYNERILGHLHRLHGGQHDDPDQSPR